MAEDQEGWNGWFLLSVASFLFVRLLIWMFPQDIPKDHAAMRQYGWYWGWMRRWEQVQDMGMWWVRHWKKCQAMMVWWQSTEEVNSNAVTMAQFVDLEAALGVGTPIYVLTCSRCGFPAALAPVTAPVAPANT